MDDGVGVLHRRQSGSIAETDYAPGIPASSGDFYGRLTVRTGNNINGDQFTRVFSKDKNGNLQVLMTIATAQGGHLVASWTLHPTCMGTQVTEGLCTNGALLPFSAAGANFLGWFPNQEINDLAVDNLSLVAKGCPNGKGRWP